MNGLLSIEARIFRIGYRSGQQDRARGHPPFPRGSDVQQAGYNFGYIGQIGASRAFLKMGPHFPAKEPLLSDFRPKIAPLSASDRKSSPIGLGLSVIGRSRGA